MRPAPLAALAFSAAALPLLAGAQPGAPSLSLPIACELGRTCEVQHYVDRDAGPGVRDYRCGIQTYDGHNGLDLRIHDMAAQRRGVDVLAAAPGRVARLRDGMPDISVKAPGAPTLANNECGNGLVVDHGGGWETQYCHLAQGLRVKVGDNVQAGQPLGRVGLSGATEFPHLHFIVRQGGKVVDPFDTGAGAACPAGGQNLWGPAARRSLAYKQGVVLNVGFAAKELTMGDVEEGGITAPSRRSPVLIAYARSIGLQPGDVVELVLTSPDGAVVAQARRPPLVRWRAQDLVYVGKRLRTESWPAGSYAAQVRIHRGGRVAIERRFTHTL